MRRVLTKRQIKIIYNALINDEHSFFLSKLSGSLGMNLLFAAFKFSMGVRYRSIWFFGVGIYYLSLCFLRIYLHYNYRTTIKIKNALEADHKRWVCCLLCGVSFCILDIVVALITWQMIFEGKVYNYPGLLIYLSFLFAVYCFYCAIRNVTSFSDQTNILFWTSKHIDLVACVMSMYTVLAAYMMRYYPNGLEIISVISLIGTLVVVVILMLAFRLMMASIGKARKLRLKINAKR